MKKEKSFLKPEAVVVEFKNDDIILTSYGLGSKDINDLDEEE